MEQLKMSGGTITSKNYQNYLSLGDEYVMKITKIVNKTEVEWKKQPFIEYEVQLGNNINVYKIFIHSRFIIEEGVKIRFRPDFNRLKDVKIIQPKNSYERYI